MGAEFISDRVLMSATKQLRIGIAIASAGRADILVQTLAYAERQTRVADAVFVCVPDEADIGSLREDHPTVTCLFAPRGLPRQRNRLMQAATGIDVLLFLDDDFVMAADYIAEIESVFSENSDVVMATGNVLADGVTTAGLSVQEAEECLSASVTPAPASLSVVYNGYGCNMAVRMAVVRSQRLQFDEELPLYAWLEDVDFSRSIARFGWIVRVNSAKGVHLGAKSGRQPGGRLGYSQIANPCYLMSKGTCSWQKGFLQMGRNLAANIYGTLRKDPDIDRPGRLRGNVTAVADLILRRMTPARALQQK